MNDEDKNGIDVIFLNKKGDALATPPIRNRKGKHMQVLINKTWTCLDNYVDYNDVGANAYNVKWEYNPKWSNITECLRRK